MKTLKRARLWLLVETLGIMLARCPQGGNHSRLKETLLHSEEWEECYESEDLLLVVKAIRKSNQMVMEEAKEGA